MNTEEEKYNQAHRILNIYRYFLSNRKLTTKEVFSKIKRKFDGVSERSVQRDLKILCDEGYINLLSRGKYSYWIINKAAAHRTGSLYLKDSELLSFHILKSYLNTFKGTSIAKDIIELSSKLETMAPGEVILEEQFYGDQNIGYYDYSTNHYQLSQCIKHITEKNWIEIQYEKQTVNETKKYIVFPQFLYTYAGTIYLLAYNKKRQRNTTFIVQNIKNIRIIYDENISEPPFDYNNFRHQRFAVFDGQIKDVKIKIDKDYTKYFENRFWHPTQKQRYDQDKNMIIKMQVPITPDLVSWICRWTDGITVLEPLELRHIVVKKLTAALNNYKDQ
jgi:predicted DNA-binding transcriptional regulator YafY